MCLLELSYHGITISISNSLEIGNEGVERIQRRSELAVGIVSTISSAKIM